MCLGLKCNVTNGTGQGRRAERLLEAWTPGFLALAVEERHASVPV